MAGAILRDPREFAHLSPKRMAANPLQAFLDVHLPEQEAVARHDEPMTIGIPFPRGALSGPREMGLFDDAGSQVPSRMRALDRWSDGSVRCALLDAQLTVERAHSRFVLRVGRNRPSLKHQLAIDEQPGSIWVSTGPARFHLAAPQFPFASVILGTRALAVRTACRISDREGRDAELHVASILVEEAGDMRAVIRVDGGWRTPSEPRFLDMTARMTFFAGLATARLAITLRNPRRAARPSGFWELGDAGSTLFSRAAVAFTADTDVTSVTCSLKAGESLHAVDVPVRISQDASGGRHERSPVHVDRQGHLPFASSGATVSSGNTTTNAQRVSPVLVATFGTCQIGVSVRHFWQNFPKSLDVAGSDLVVGLFPDRPAHLHELQGGEQKTHEFEITFGADPVCEHQLAWCRSPLRISATPEWYAECGIAPEMVPRAHDPNVRYRSLLDGVIEGHDSFAAKRERIDEFGWRNFGDIYADHEAAFHTGDVPLVSHYNNQYDAIAGFAVQFMSTGDHRWHESMCELAAHVWDIDIYHTVDDKPAYNGGLFWHTVHYVDAGKSTHRSYPRSPGVSGGGPSAEHNYATGFLLHHLLTGSPSSREAVVTLADWVLDMDDGNRTPLRWLSRRHTGLASSTRDPDYHGPGRGAANSIVTLLSAHQLTHAAKYLDKAELLLQRCIHPEDDVAALDLLNVERRWSYTVFLQALGRYLAYKASLNQYDASYSYARRSLLRYARWMADHERPYLERPQTLEFPNVTWAAQDMRKSDVFDLAALHSSGAERARFLERAEFFFDYVLQTVPTMPGYACARPMVLLLTNGFRRSFWAAGLEPPAAPITAEQVFTQRQPFRRQRAVAIRRLMGLAALAIALVALAATWMMRQ